MSLMKKYLTSSWSTQNKHSHLNDLSMINLDFVKLSKILYRFFHKMIVFSCKNVNYSVFYN